MNLHVTGLGLVSPIALDPRQHVAVIHAGLGMNPPSAFWRDDEPLPIRHVTWLGATMPMRERLVRLATHAINSAMPAAPPAKARTPLFIVAPRPRVGVPRAEIAAAIEGIAGALPFAIEIVDAPLTGAAAAFHALTLVENRFARGAEVALIVAFDSMISLEAVVDAAPAMRSAWTADPAPPSEGAAAIAIVPRASAPLGRIVGAATAMGAANDDNDAIVDGVAMTTLLDALSRGARVGRAYGQARVDRLRLHEWTYAAARCADRVDPKYQSLTLEDATGALGAAAGLASIVHAIQAERTAASLGPAFAWAISDDGTRGLARLEIDR